MGTIASGLERWEPSSSKSMPGLSPSWPNLKQVLRWKFWTPPPQLVVDGPRGGNFRNDMIIWYEIESRIFNTKSYYVVFVSEF